MRTRSGAIDPGIMFHLLRHGTDLDSLEQTLNKKSGLAGLSVVRQRTCDAFGFLGLRLDSDLNASSPVDADIAAADSSVRVVIVRGQENWQIAAESVEAWRLEKQMTSD